MAHRLLDALDEAAFDYTQEEFEQDIIDIENLADATEEPVETQSVKEKLVSGGKKTFDNISGFFGGKKQKNVDTEEDPIDKIKKLAELRDLGILTEEEFNSKKAELRTKV